MKNNSNVEFGPTDAASGKRRRSGRVTHEDGRGIWEWQTSTGVFTKDVSDDHLRRLERSDLRVVEHAPVVVEDPMHKILDRLATSTNVKSKPNKVAVKTTKGAWRTLLQKWVG